MSKRKIMELRVTYDICIVCKGVKYLYFDICPKCRGWKRKKIDGHYVYVGDEELDD